MKISIHWLREYIELPSDISVEEIAKRLTFAGFEVEAIVNLAKGLDKVFVGKILERKQHPNADRLSLCTIDIGSALTTNGDLLEIVCGAQNIKAGQHIPVATLGALLPNGLEIKAAKIRGVSSSGMLCSLDELKLPKDWQAEDGIYILPEEAQIGTPIAQILGLEDHILEISVTPNRGDALSHVGIAREVAALFSVNMRWPEFSLQETAGAEKFAVSVKRENKELCSSYYARLVEGITISPSPVWLKKKIEAIGLRSINNIVDITSFVMFEVGQPLHAFDADTLSKDGKNIEIQVRKAVEHEKFTTLSEKNLVLNSEDLVISTGHEAVALAGVMGGKNSEVTDRTVNVLLEAADFHPVSVRKTGRRLNLLTDAGYRFERGIDPARVKWALDRATALILDLAGGKARNAVCSQEELEPAISIRLRHSEIQRLLGKAPELPKVISILRSLGFAAEMSAGEPNVVNVQVPKWRKDCKRIADIIEEIVRIWGFDHLESKLPLGGIGQVEPKASKRQSYFQVRRLRRHLSSLGFFEALNHGFTSMDALAKLMKQEELKNIVEIANPVTQDYSVLKPTLLAGLLENVAHNFSHKQKKLRLFEVRRSFLGCEEKTDPRLDTGVKETMRVSFAISGGDEFWEKKEELDFYSLKGVLDSVFDLLGVAKIKYSTENIPSYLHPGQAATIKFGDKILGIAGRTHPRVEKNYGFEQAVFVAELNLDLLLQDELKLASFQPYSNFPFVERDFSALVKIEVDAQMIRSLVEKLSKPLLKEFHYFDVYRGARVPEGYISYAFRIVLGSDDHTLTDQEIGSVQEKIMQGLEKEFSARFAGLA